MKKRYRYFYFYFENTEGYKNVAVYGS